jgi:hypothetical protein
MVRGSGLFDGTPMEDLGVHPGPYRTLLRAQDLQTSSRDESG